MTKQELRIVDFIWALFEDVDHFLREADKNQNDLMSQQRHLRVSILCAWGAFEGWINKTCSDFATTDSSLAPCELGFLLERRVRLEKGEFYVSNSDKYESTEAKLEFLLRRFGQTKLNKSTVQWERYQAAKHMRDSIVHPKNNRPMKLEVADVKQAVKALKDYINLMSNKIYKRSPLNTHA